MQQSDFEGIKRSGATAYERGLTFFETSHHSDPGDDWLVAATAWSAGWREAD